MDNASRLQKILIGKTPKCAVDECNLEIPKCPENMIDLIKTKTTSPSRAIGKNTRKISKTSLNMEPVQKPYFSKLCLDKYPTTSQKTFIKSKDVKTLPSRLPFDVPGVSHHQVVDVVPNPSRIHTLDYSVPDQTIGIPISDSRTYSDAQNTIQPLPDRLFPQFGPAISNRPQMIHHPLICGNIPSTTYSMSDNHLTKDISKRTLLDFPKSVSRRHMKISSSILSATMENTSVTRKEYGEKNKVKFSNMVTVAVVPVSSLSLTCCQYQ